MPGAMVRRQARGSTPQGHTAKAGHAVSQHELGAISWLLGYPRKAVVLKPGMEAGGGGGMAVQLLAHFTTGCWRRATLLMPGTLGASMSPQVWANSAFC